MPTLSENPRLRLVFLCSLYIGQGLPFGFITVALRDYLHAQGVSQADTGAMIAMVGLPWTFKFIWGPIIDRWEFRAMGKRRPWLLLAQTMMILILVVLACLPDLTGDLQRLGIAILVLNIFIALQDVSTDSLAVDLVPEEHRGRANGFMYGSSYVGSSLGAALVGGFLPTPEGGGSVSLAFLVLAGATFLLMQGSLFLRERPGEKWLPWTAGRAQLNADEAPAESLRELFLVLARAFRRPVAYLAAGFAMVALTANTMLSVVGSSFFVKEVGWEAADYSALEGLAMWFSFGGSVTAGIIVDRLGIKRGVFLAGTLLAMTWIAFRFCGSLYETPAFVSTFRLTQSVLLGFFAASMFSLFMQIANRRVAATQFTAYMALLNVSIVLGGKATGWLGEFIPSAPDLFLAGGLFQLALMIYFVLAVNLKTEPQASSPTSSGTGATAD